MSEAEQMLHGNNSQLTRTYEKEYSTGDRTLLSHAHEAHTEIRRYNHNHNHKRTHKRTRTYAHAHDHAHPLQDKGYGDIGAGVLLPDVGDVCRLSEATTPCIAGIAARAMHSNGAGASVAILEKNENTSAEPFSRIMSFL